MPGTPATAPRTGAPRYANADAVDFAGQVNAITDQLDAIVALLGTTRTNDDNLALANTRTIGVKNTAGTLTGIQVDASNNILVGSLSSSGFNDTRVQGGASVTIHTNGARRGIVNSAGLLTWDFDLNVIGALSKGGIAAVLTNDSRLSDARTPTGTAGGALQGTYPNPTIVPRTRREQHTWGIGGEIAVASGDTDFIPPMFVDLRGTETLSFQRVRCIINGGTQVTFDLRRRTPGGAETNLITGANATTGINTYANGVTLADGDRIYPVVLGASGARNLTITAAFDRTL